MPDTTQEFTADDALQTRLNVYEEELEAIDKRLGILESFIRGNDKLCPPDGDNTFCESQGGGKRKKRRRKSRKKKRKTNKKKRKRKRKTKRKRRR